MNILIIGLGSIGQRHLRNLKLIEPKSNFYAIKRNREKSTPLLNNFNQVLNGNIKKKYSLTYFNSLYEIYKSTGKSTTCTSMPAPTTGMDTGMEGIEAFGGVEEGANEGKSNKK